MDKPVVVYEARQQDNRATGGVIFVPVIVDRDDSLPLDEVIRRAIVQGRIVGLKDSAVSGIADAIARQIYEELKQGNGVRFGNYFYARIYLKGTTDGNGTLDPEKNEVVVRLVKGDGFKLALDMFDFQNKGAGNIPSIDFLISEDDDAVRNALVHGANVMLNGERLWAETDVSTKVRFTEVVESGEAATFDVTEFESRGPALLTFAYPQALTRGRWLVEVQREDEGGATRRSASVEITA